MTHPNWHAEGQAALGDRPTAARETCAASLTEAAMHLGLRERIPRDRENDRAAPRANRLPMLAASYGVVHRRLMTGEGDGLVPPGGGADSPRGRERAQADLGRVQSERPSVQHRRCRIARAVARQQRGGAHG